MRISNKRKFNKINLCDLMKELGRNFACLEINKAFTTPPIWKLALHKGLSHYVIANVVKQSLAKMGLRVAL